MKRVFFLVLDSVGIGEMPDAKDFGDAGAHTLGHIAEKTLGLKIPNLSRMGIGNIVNLKGISPCTKTIASYGKAAELAKGKDTSTGHWEMAGISVTKPFPTYYQGFPQSFIDAFIEKSKIPGIIGNYAASGTEIIQTLGDEHVQSGKPIVYTSADSVFQIACHEKSFGLDRLYQISEIARKLCDDFGVARVISRPFIGEKGNYTRTKNRKDYSIELPEEPMMEKLQRQGTTTISIGKVASIYSERGFDRKVKASDNRAILEAVLEEAKTLKEGFVFANLVDFDMLYGHRRNTQGYAAELEWFDAEIPKLLSLLREGDLLLLSADHGNDPTFPGTDHTREYVPVIAWSKKTETNGGKNLGTLSTFADIGQTILDAFSCKERQRIGTSFLTKV